ncbi:InlB B-repeat-containing protein [Gottfriedia acidiceleris]|uniref:InlB B-repeat-containing protein n=1 Tax=Gottfriedia acidiceleris TaxID=371036 RepID=UPI003D205F47
MSKKKKKRTLSAVALSSAMLLNVVLPQSAILAHAESNIDQNSPSNGKFTADEVNRILAGLTPEQKANINKLTGADNTQKIRVDQKDLRKGGNIDVIVQFKTDPAKIQIIKDSLEKGGATANTQAFASEFSAAKNKVEASHANFKKFVNAQPTSQVISGKPVNLDIKINKEYKDSFNGVLLSVPTNLVTKIAENQEVASVWPVMDFNVDEGAATQAEATTGKMTEGLKTVGADKLQAEGTTGVIKSGPRAGQKVKVGVLDTGIDYNHPDLYKVTHDANGHLYEGHDFVNSEVDGDGNVTYVDDHDPMETTYQDWLNDKENPNPLIGPPPSNYKSYITSHGTHVSGTIAANTTSNNAGYSANGVAPDVELHGYRVLGPGGRGTADSVLNGIDQAVKDDMDVINLSLGANVNDPLYPTSVAINNATLQGVVCAVAAGNAGPGQATVGSPGSSPLAITVGASSIQEEIAALTVKFGTTSYPAHLFGKDFSQADNEFKGQTLPIVDVGSGTPDDYSGKDMAGKIALVKRGGDYLSTKMANAKAAGAKGMLIWNDRDDTETSGYIPSFLGVNMDNIYSISLTNAQGKALVDAIKAKPETASITFPTILDAPTIVKGDELASFSSTGPVRDWTIKPDIVAPGVDIFSTVPYDVWEPNEKKDYKNSYESMSGTSMATPHVAGISALVLAAHPDYTPADVKTALMNTAKDINTDSKTYSVYQVGAGRVDAYRAVHANIKIQVLDKTNTVDSSDGPDQIVQVDDITGSLNFGFKGRGEGATNGSDDVVQSKDFNVSNSGTGSKTFKVSTEFLSTKFAQSNKVGPGTGNDVKIDVSVNGSNAQSITVDGGNTVKASAKITVPSNAEDGTYEGYVNLVNANDATEHYRLPFTITISEKGLNFKVDIKAMTGLERYTGNYNPNMGAPASGYTFSVNSAMESLYILLKDQDGKYLGVIQNAMPINGAGPGVVYGPYYMLSGGNYLPFTKDYNGSLDQSGISSTPAVIKDGAYSIEMIATDANGKQYKKEDTLYVDYQAPTLTMDQDSQPGIYEIDPTGWEPGQEIKKFYGKVYDSNVDRMKNNGETSVRDIEDPNKQAPVDQGLNLVWGYQDGPFVSKIFRTDAEGRFNFGISKEDITPQGSEFWLYPSDYAQAGDVNSTQQMYYFIKKGSPYLTLQSTGGVDQSLEGQGKTVVQKDKPFNGKIAAKYALGMTGGSLTLNSNIFTFSNIRLSQEYKDYLNSKGITPPTLTIGAPYDDNRNGGTSTDVTIPNVGATGALDADHQNINLFDIDVTYSSSNSSLVGPIGYFVYNSKLNLSGVDSKVPTFMKNWPYVKAAKSSITGGMFAESFKANSLSGSFTGITKESLGKVTVTDDKGNTFTTDSPNSDNNNSIQYQGNQTGTYGVVADVSDKPYSVEVSMPGHFKGYQKTPAIGNSRYGYQSGSSYDFPSSQTPLLLGGDVNGDDVIDMKDLVSEVTTYYNWKDLTSLSNPVPAGTTAKNAFLAANRNADIRWIAPGGFGQAVIDYNDFYFIFKNFGKQNQSAISSGKSVPSPQLTIDKDTDITTTYGGSISLKAGDNLSAVMTKLNFAGPLQTTSSSTVPMLQDLKNGATISLVPNNSYILDDEVWRKAITKVLLGSTDVTSNITIKEGYTYFDSQKGYTTVPSKITFPGSLFATAGTYNVTIKATGYQDVTKSFTVSEIPISTPTISLVQDGAKAHIGQDLTVTFTDDANWRNGINRITMRQYNASAGTIDVPSSYYDITQSGKIIFNKELFKTNSAVGTSAQINTALINPGGANYLPQTYQFVVYSTGTDGTIYPGVTIGKYTGDTSSTPTAAQPVGYALSFDSQGGSAIPTTAVSYNPSRNKTGPNSSDFYISSSTPTPTRPGYKFMGWYNDSAYTSVFDSNAMLTGDKTVYAKWQMNVTQNYSLVDPSNPNGPKFDGNTSSVSGKGWILGEGDLQVTIPDYTKNVSWLTSKNDIQKIEKTYYKLKPDGAREATTTTEQIDPSTYTFTGNGSGNGTFSFTTATEKYAADHPTEKFAFSAAPYINFTPTAGYQITITSISGQTVTIPDIKLGYRRHIDLNGGTLKNLNDTFFYDSIINGKMYGISMDSAAAKLVNGDLTIMPKLYSNASGTSGAALDIDQSKALVITDNTNVYISWVKPAPTVSKDVLGNVIGSDITLPFTDDGIWKNNIKQVSIGSKNLVLGTDYKITYDSNTHKGSFTLDKSLFKAGQKFNVTITSEGYRDAIVIDQLIGYQVNFESNGGDSVAPVIVDSRVTKPTDPTKVGYKFMGWYSDEALTTPYDFASIVTKPITLYAKYALATSIVSPDTTDNALGNDITLEFSDKDWANAITSIKVGGSVIDSLTYKIDATNGTLTIDKSAFKKVGDFNITISAKDYADVSVQQKVLNGYNVHFVLTGDKAPFEVKDQIVTRRITEPVVYGYDLSWFIDSDHTIPWDFTNSIYSAKTIYGKWSVHKFTVEFNKQDGGLVETKKVDYNTTMTAPTAPTRTGYTFVGWYKDAAGQTPWNFATDKVTADTELFAKWNINSYTVKFDSQGGSAVDAIKANYNTMIAQPTVPTRTGYTFAGWYKDAAGQTPWNFATDKVTSDTTMYAKWSLNKPIVNKIDENDPKISGTTLANATITVKINDVVIATGKADSKGIFSIQIKQQKVGTELSIYAKDSTGNESSATKVKVLEHTQPK